MGIGGRLFKMARSELNALLDRAAEAEQVGQGHRDPDEDLYRRFSLDQLTDAELEAEIERRMRARQAAARGAERGTTSAKAGGAGRASSASARPKPGPAPRPASPDQELRRAYAALEVPVGADFATVRKAYRNLMRKYHPDHHAGSPEKQKAATELAQNLTAAFALIEQRARK